MERSRRAVEETHHRHAPPDTETWIRDDGPVPSPRRPDQPRRAPEGAGRRRAKPLPAEVASELAEAGGARNAPRLQRDLAAAAAAYAAGRYPDALKLLKPLAEVAPSAPGVRELRGLTLYHLGRWKAAIAELDAYHLLTESPDQLPVVADCERALGRHDAVDALWAQLRTASPGVEVLAEGRLVAAGSLADRGRLTDAIELLARYEADRARPKPWHVRTWYALADLYERAGEVPRARMLFGRLVRFDADFFDVAERLAALR